MKQPFLWAGIATVLLVSGIVILRAPSNTGPPIESLAVLPFENSRNDPAVDYLTEGIPESLINRLAQTEALQVKARSTAFRFRGRLDPQEVGQALGVAAVLTGRILQQGDTLNVQVELVDVAKGNQLWGEQYSRDMAEIVSVQNDIAREITNALRLKLTSTQEEQLAAPETPVGEAYQAYWKEVRSEGVEMK